jgi:glycosyltransferase involved in cell wall biosynthesis
MLFSVIVPVYNTAAYLEDSIRSILAQTFADWELILADDGSTDGSAEICDAFAQKDARIHVLHQKNAGVSAARNAAMDAARGTYFCYVDSDDRIKPGCLAALAEAIEQTHAEYLSFGFEYVCGETSERRFVTESFYAPDKTALKQWFNDFYAKLFGTVCAKCYKAACIRKAGLRFPLDMRINEDAFFDFDMLETAGSYCNIGEIFYEYVQHDTSSSHKGRTGILAVFEKRAKRYRLFMQRMGYADDPAIQKENSLKIGTLSQYMQAAASTTDFSLGQRCAILKALYAVPEYRQYILDEMKSQPGSLPYLLGRLAAELRMPALVAMPVVLKQKMAARRQKGTL